MKILIFDTTISGHYLEYMHHYYVGAMHSSNDYVFAVPEEFYSIKDTFYWPPAGNISFVIIEQKYIDVINKEKNKLKYGYKSASLLQHFVKKTSCNKVIVTNLARYVPFALFMLPKHVTLSGIIYKIYLYTESSRKRYMVLIDKIKYHLIAKSKKLEYAYILNDKWAAKKFNDLYSTSKFVYLPDPIPDIDFDSLIDLRKTFKIPVDSRIYFQFGVLGERKGTLEILKAIVSKDKDVCSSTFIFAGRLGLDIKNEFNNLVDIANQHTRVIVIDKFCQYDLLFNLCYTCDVILMPYSVTDLSSGVLGYAAVFGKPVIGPGSGLIGKLIKEYNLGYTLKKCSASAILEALKDESLNSEVTNLYPVTHTSAEFINTIIK